MLRLVSAIVLSRLASPHPVVRTGLDRVMRATVPLHAEDWVNLAPAAPEGGAHGRLRQHSCESVTAAEVSRATRAAHSLPLLGDASYGVELVLLLLLPQPANLNQARALTFG